MPLIRLTKASVDTLLDQVKSKPLSSLIDKAKALDEGLVEKGILAEASRTKLGMFHKALGLNQNLKTELPKVIVLELMHNMAERLVSFIEALMKLEPSVLQNHAQKASTDFSFSKIVLTDPILDQAVYVYRMSHKSGYEIRVQKEGDSYEIGIKDSGFYSKLVSKDVDAGLEYRTTDEGIDFYFTPKQIGGQYISLGSKTSQALDHSPVGKFSFKNFEDYINAKNKAITLHELDHIDLNQDTPFIKSLISVLDSVEKG